MKFHQFYPPFGMEPKLSTLIRAVSWGGSLLVVVWLVARGWGGWWKMLKPVKAWVEHGNEAKFVILP